MITELELRNFKSFRSLSVELGGLNVLTGLNGSGKSSFIQSLLFLKSLADNAGRNSLRVGLKGEDHDFGSYADLQYAYSQTADDDRIRVSVKLEGLSGAVTFSVREADSRADEVYIDRTDDLADEEVVAFCDQIRAIQFVSAYRLPPTLEHKYSLTRVRDRDWGAMGEQAVGFLAEKGMSLMVNESLCHQSECDSHLGPQVNAWMGVVSPGAQIRAEMMGQYKKALLSVSFARGADNHPFLPQNVGFGISYVLPVVVMLLSAKSGDCIVVENPEAHLHPQGQAELGRLLALVANTGVQLFVETHSDHILNGIRVAVKKKNVRPGCVNVMYFVRREKADEGSGYQQESKFEKIRIAPNGEFDHFPPGFMEEWNKQLLELLQP